MTVKKFFLSGHSTNTAVELDITAVNTLDELQRSIGAHFGVVQPEGLAFQAGETVLEEFNDVTSSDAPIGITVDGHSVRNVPGPQGLPYVGNYFEGELRRLHYSSAETEGTCSLPRSSWQQSASVRQIWSHFQVDQHGQDSLPDQ